jgi:RimJ/RimL family protein N-acetyltransferase
MLGGIVTVSQTSSISMLPLADHDARITTDRLELVPLLREHADDLFTVLSDTSLYEYTHDVPPVSAAALRDRYTFLESRQSPDGTQAWLNWVLCERATRLSIGFVQATVESDRADVAWVIGAPWQRRGYATEAVVALIVWLHCAGVRVVRAKINPSHTASQRVAAKAGLALSQEVIDGENLWVRHL